MRSVPLSVSKTLSWKRALVVRVLLISMLTYLHTGFTQRSQLAFILCTLATPGQIFELCQHVIDSRNSAVWADIFGALVIRWTNKDALERLKRQVSKTHTDVRYAD